MTEQHARLLTDLETRDRELALRSQELRQSEARFRDVIERNADAIVVVDREGVVRFANRVAAQLFGSTSDTLQGTPFGFPLVSGETTELDLVRNGSARVVEMRVVDSEWEGTPAWIATLRDVTDRKRAEENARRLIGEQAARLAAEEAARRFRFIADCSSMLSSTLDYDATLSVLAHMCITELADWVIVYTIDDNGLIHRVEVASRDSAKAEWARQVKEAPMDTARIAPIVEVLRTRKPKLVQSVTKAAFDSITQDEQQKQVLRELGFASYMIVPLIARNQAVGAVALVSAREEQPFDEEDLALAEDLALRAALAVDNARLYQEAQRANQSKSDFLAVISHDLRTPLASIIGYSELMSLGIPDQLTESGKQRIERIQTAARHLLYLLDELLNFARLEARREELRLQQVDTSTLVREVAEVMEPLAVERHLQLTIDVPSTPIQIETDPDKLRQVLVNLVGNAVKYTSEGGASLSVQRGSGDSIMFVVRDTGIGIGSQHLPHIFDPFWQADATARARGSGTGLGLSVVRRLVEFLGGEVEVESELGKGSTFTVTLPGRRGVPVKIVG
jgi:signal transduction histidine kinase